MVYIFRLFSSGRLFIFIYQFFCSLDEREKNNIFKIFIVCTFIQKIIAIIQLMGYFTFAGLSGRSSITALIGNPNILSYILVISGIISFILYKKENNRFYLYLTIFDVIFPFILFSRGAILGIIFLIFYFFGIKKAFIAGSAGLILAFFIGFRTNIINDSVFQRIFIWKNALIQFSENIFTGIGFGNFKNAFPYFNIKVFKPFYSAFIPENTYAMQTHNDFLQFISETGISGFILIILFFIFLWKNRNFSNYLLSAVYFTMIFAFFDFPFHNISSSFVFIMVFSYAIPSENINLNFKKSKKILLFILLGFLTLRVCYHGMKYNISYIYLSKALKENNIQEKYKLLEYSVYLHDNAHSYYEKGNIELYLKNNEKAVKSFSKALTISGQSAVRSHIANILYISNDLKQCLIFYEDAWKKDPFNLNNLLKLIEISEKLDEQEKAMYYINLNDEINNYRKLGGNNGALEILYKEIKKR